MKLNIRITGSNQDPKYDEPGNIDLNCIHIIHSNTGSTAIYTATAADTIRLINFMKKHNRKYKENTRRGEICIEASSCRDMIFRAWE